MSVVLGERKPSLTGKKHQSAPKNARRGGEHKAQQNAQAETERYTGQHATTKFVDSYGVRWRNHRRSAAYTTASRMPTTTTYADFSHNAVEHASGRRERQVSQPSIYWPRRRRPSSDEQTGECQHPHYTGSWLLFTSTIALILMAIHVAESVNDGGVKVTSDQAKAGQH